MTGGTRQPIQRIAVTMPAHDEEQHIGRALAALGIALNTLEREHPGMPATVTVVLDSCTDRSARITAAHVAADPRFTSVSVQLRSAGACRDYGIRTALLSHPTEAAGSLWLANTDADSVVPPNWLVRQVGMANAGADVVLGSVEPDAYDVDPAVLRRWLELHPFRENHQHIYGANLGIRASAYLAAGGFPHLRAHEDRRLVERTRHQGFRVAATDSIRVLTSGRTQARAPEGFAAYLLALGAEVPAATGS